MSVDNMVGGLAGKRVLVIEDESLLTMMLEDYLEDFGCEVAGTAARLNNALEKAAALSFDVAILDVNLHGEQTFPVAAALSTRNIPFVFATGYGTAGLPSELKFIPVLQKPFQQADLEKALLTAIAGKGR